MEIRRLTVITIHDGQIRDVVCQDNASQILTKFLKRWIWRAVKSGCTVAIYEDVPEDNFTLVPLVVSSL